MSAALRSLLERQIHPPTVAGLAVARGPDAPPEAVWTPASLGEEPAFLAYSITKTMLATLALRLQEEGRLALDHRLDRWLPGVPEASRISLRRLLDHTAGLPDYGRLRAYHDAVRRSPGKPWSFERFAAMTYEGGTIFEPGQGWAYSNPGYMLVKRILEETGGEPLASLVASRIAAPLGLRRTSVAESIDDLADLAPAPSAMLSEDGELHDTRGRYHPGWVCHGTVTSTASEIARFLQGLFAGRLVSESSLEAMTTAVPVPEAPPQWEQPGYGLGLMLDRASPWGRLAGHGGGGPGYHSAAFRASGPDGRGVAVCALCASERDGQAEDLVRATLDLAHAARGERQGDRLLAGPRIRGRRGAFMKIAYVNVFVSDLDRALGFYAGALGLPLDQKAPEHGYASLSAGPVRLGLAVAGADQQELVGRHTGIGLDVADLAAEHARLSERGVAFPMPPSRQPWGGFMALCCDPDGNVLYLDEVSAAHG
ncbi:MAG: serine hydrolase [Myxococcota bacterium]